MEKKTTEKSPKANGPKTVFITNGKPIAALLMAELITKEFKL